MHLKLLKCTYIKPNLYVVDKSVCVCVCVCVRACARVHKSVIFWVRCVTSLFALISLVFVAALPQASTRLKVSYRVRLFLNVCLCLSIFYIETSEMRRPSHEMVCFATEKEMSFYLC
jgi:hypothetical protein